MQKSPFWHSPRGDESREVGRSVYPNRRVPKDSPARPAADERERATRRLRRNADACVGIHELPSSLSRLSDPESLEEKTIGWASAHGSPKTAGGLKATLCMWNDREEGVVNCLSRRRSMAQTSCNISSGPHGSPRSDSALLWSGHFTYSECFLQTAGLACVRSEPCRTLLRGIALTPPSGGFLSRWVSSLLWSACGPPDPCIRLGDSSVLL